MLQNVQTCNSITRFRLHLFLGICFLILSEHFVQGLGSFILCRHFARSCFLLLNYFVHNLWHLRFPFSLIIAVPKDKRWCINV